MSKCVFQGAIQHVNANIEETLDSVRFHLIGCFFTIRLATISLTADSTNPAEIRCPAR